MYVYVVYVGYVGYVVCVLGCMTKHTTFMFVYFIFSCVDLIFPFCDSILLSFDHVLFSNLVTFKDIITTAKINKNITTVAAMTATSIRLR